MALLNKGHKNSKEDNYFTPKWCWEDIKDLIPKDKVIWEAFPGNFQSGTALQNLGFETINRDVDFFKNDLGDIIVSNPPFSKIPQILKRLKMIDKPFILIMPVGKITTQYFKKTFIKGRRRKTKLLETPHNIQIIVPRKRINFDKLNEKGEVVKTKSASFDCFYYCWRMNLPNDINFV